MKKKILILTAAVLACLLMAVTVAANPAITRLEVAVTNHFVLEIDEEVVRLPQGQHILNYNNRIYLPFRFIGEAMGAEVDFDSETYRVIVTSPEPVVVEAEAEPEEEPEEEDEEEEPETERPQAARTFFYLPCKLRINEVTIIVFGIDTDRSGGVTAVHMDISNEGRGDILFDYANAYIETDRGTFEAMPNQRTWLNPRSVQRYEDEVMLFEAFTTWNNFITIVIPVEFANAPTRVFRFPIDVSELR